MTATLDTPVVTKSTIYEALAAVMADVKSVGKRSFNEQHKFHFRGIDAVVNAAHPALVKHGVIVVPELLEKEYGTVEVGHKRTRMAHCQVKVRYRFYGPDGSSIDVTVPGEAMDSGDKATPKAMSVAFRIALLQALSLPTDDPDPDATSYERSAAPKTDQAWRAQMEQRVNNATNAAELQALSEEMESKREAGECEDTDFERLWNLGLEKYNRLSQAPAAPPATPQQSEHQADSQGTDRMWLEGMVSRLQSASSTKDLAALAAEIQNVKAEGRCEPDDEAKLIALGKQRQQDLASTTPERPTEPDTPPVAEGPGPVEQFKARIAATATVAEVEQIKAEVMDAFKSQRLDPTGGNRLIREIKARQTELEEMA